MKKIYDVSPFYNTFDINNMFSKYMSWFHSDGYKVTTYNDIDISLWSYIRYTLPDNIRVFIFYNNYLIIVIFDHYDISFLHYAYKKSNCFVIPAKSKNTHITNKILNDNCLKL